MQYCICNLLNLLLCLFAQEGNYPVALQTWRQRWASYLEASSSVLEFLSSKQLYLSEDWCHLRRILLILTSHWEHDGFQCYFIMPCATFTPLLFIPGQVEALTLTAAAQQSVPNAERLPWGFGRRLRLTAGCTVRTHILLNTEHKAILCSSTIYARKEEKRNVQKTSKTSELCTKAIFLVITGRLSTQNLCLLHYQLGLHNLGGKFWVTFLIKIAIAI